MNPRDEARARLDHAYEVMVLEPSPPAVLHEPFSDDPTARADVPPGRQLVAPIETGVDGDLTWDALARDDPELARWCAARALGAWAPPPPPPPAPTYVETRRSLHALAEHVLCPARHRANGKIGLRFTRGGFGTPFFGADEQVRIEGSTLVHTVFTAARDVRETRTELTTIGAAASAIGIEAGAPDVFEPSAPLDLDRPLALDAAAVAVVGWWYGIAAAVLAQVRADPESNASPDAPSLVQLWPEHFDMAVEVGDGGAGTRANFGASPGDADHPEPYLYVGPWDRARLAAGGGPGRSDPYWNEPFGASLPYSELSGPAGAREAALSFLRAGRARLLA
jgi:hypothetical protein